MFSKENLNHAKYSLKMEKIVNISMSSPNDGILTEIRFCFLYSLICNNKIWILAPKGDHGAQKSEKYCSLPSFKTKKVLNLGCYKIPLFQPLWF